MSTKTSKRRKPKGFVKGLSILGLGALTIVQPETAILTVPGILALLGAK